MYAAFLFVMEKFDVFAEYLATGKLFKQIFTTTCSALYKYFKPDMHWGMYLTVSVLTGVGLAIAMA